MAASAAGADPDAPGLAREAAVHVGVGTEALPVEHHSVGPRALDLLAELERAGARSRLRGDGVAAAEQRDSLVGAALLPVAPQLAAERDLVASVHGLVAHLERQARRLDARVSDG